MVRVHKGSGKKKHRAVHELKMVDFSEGRSFTGDDEETDNFSMLCINDALHRQSTMYYIDEDTGHVETIWEKTTAGREWGLFFRSDRVTWTLSSLAYLDLLFSITAPPGIPGAPLWLKPTSMVLQFLVYITMLTALLFRIRYIWACLLYTSPSPRDS